MDFKSTFNKIRNGLSRYPDMFNPASFWQKIGKVAKRLGRDAIRTILILFYTMQRPDVPAQVKMTILGTLGYFISPLDLIPDIIPIVGYSDDLAIAGLCLAYVSSYITQEEKDKADKKLREWFG